MNKDEGAYRLHNIYDQLITPSTTAVKSYKKRQYQMMSCQSEEATSLVVKRH